MNINIETHSCISVHLHTFEHTDICTFKLIYIYIYINARIHINTNTCEYTLLNMHILIIVHAHIRTYIHT